MKAAFVVCVAAAAAALQLAAGAPDDVFASKRVFSGDGTYYGDRKRGFGHCSFHFHGFGDSKGYVGTPLAINAAQYKGTAVCGLCVKYRGTGVGLGYNPISTAWQPGFICDECPECRFGDLDKQMNGDGRWRIEWYAVQCPVGDSTFRYGFQRGNAWYRKMMVANARVPVREVKLWVDGGWRAMKPTIDNYHEFWGDASRVWTPCARVQVTSILGDTVEDSVCCGYGECTGKAQFACKPDLPSDDCAGSQQPAKVNVGGIGQAGGSSSSAGSSSSGGSGGFQAPSYRRAAEFAAARLDVNKRYVAKGQQCGGAKFRCADFGPEACKDAVFPNTFCEPGLSCKRNDANWWGCA